MTKRDFIRSNLALTNEQIVAAWESEPSRFVPVPSKSVASWLGDDSRLKRLLAFVAEPAPDQLSDEQRTAWDKLQNAVLVIQLVAGNPTMELLMSPTDKHRQMLDGLVAFGKLTDADRDSLVNRAVVPGLEESLTSDEIDAERKQAERDTTAAGLIEQSRAWEQTQTAAIAGRAATFVTAVESWRANGGVVPEIASV